jgi:A/G-specific adenine glycosylase
VESGAPGSIDTFRDAVWSFYRENGRRLPWRETDDPYAVLVSEVMLQQTQVARVASKYVEFLEAFPTLDALAAAPFPAVLAVWSGLGYNRRAVNLKRCAEVLSAERGGSVPDDVDALVALPGVGRATAAAVLTYAFGQVVPFVETNVRTVFLHHFFSGMDDVPDREIMLLVEATWDRADPRGWGWALMDYGTYLKRAMPNPSRRSRHHVVQSRFEGSDRQVRGALLRALMTAAPASTDDLAQVTGAESARVARLLAELAGEGFLTGDADGWSIRQ